MADPSDILALDEITRATGLRVQPVFTTETDLEWALAQLFDDVSGKVNRAVSLVDANEFGEGHTNGDGVDEGGLVLGNEQSPPLIQRVYSTLQGAIAARTHTVNLQ